MWNTKRLCICLLACSLWLAAGSTSQAEEMYQISESELTSLEVNLNQLKKNNETKQQLLTEQQMQLTEASQQLETVQKELTASKNLNEATQKSLDKANKYLKEYGQEVNHKMEVKDRQLRTWKGISIILTGIVVKKAIK